MTKNGFRKFRCSQSKVAHAGKAENLHSRVSAQLRPYKERRNVSPRGGANRGSRGW